MTNSPELHRKSTLPSILNAYLPPGHKKLVQNENKIVSKKKHPVKKRNFNKKTSAAAADDDDEDDEDEDDDEEIKITKQAILDQRHLEAYKNMYRLRDAMHLHYRDLLREKVQKQRQQIRERSLKLQKQTEKPRGQTVSGQKLAYSKLSHDDKYLQSIPKSSYYLIIDMQNQMAQCGLLKTRRDNEEFWHLVQQCQHTSQLKKKLKEIKSRMTKSAPNLHGQPDTVNPDQGEELLGENMSSELLPAKLLKGDSQLTFFTNASECWEDQQGCRQTVRSPRRLSSCPRPEAGHMGPCLPSQPLHKHSSTQPPLPSPLTRAEEITVHRVVRGGPNKGTEQEKALFNKR